MDSIREIPLQELEDLEGGLDTRGIKLGISQMSALYKWVILVLTPHIPNATRFLAVLSLWVDTGFGGMDALRVAHNKFGKFPLKSINAQDLAYHLFALAMYYFLREDIDEAQKHFRRADDAFAQDAFDQIDAAPFYSNMISYYLARCARNRGQYPVAMDKTLEAERMAYQRSAPKLAAVIGSTRAWLLWQKNDPGATELLEECARTVWETDDFTAKASIESMRGRMERRKGLYKKSVVHFEESVRLATMGNANHPKYARYLINLAAAKRLLAREREAELQRLADKSRDEVAEQRSMERAVARHRRHYEQTKDERYAELAATPAVVSFVGHRARTDWLQKRRDEYVAQRDIIRNEVETLRTAAAQEFLKAKETFELLADQKGIGLVHFYGGLLQLDKDEFAEAAASGAAAYEAAIASKNPILEARARLLQCLAAKASGDAELHEPSPGHFYCAALTYGQNAVRVAEKKAFHKRIQARALLALGEVYATGFFANRVDAIKCCKKAEMLLEASDRDYVWRAYRELSGRLYEGGAEPAKELVAFVQELLTNAVTGEWNRKQIIEAFEELVIVQVWKAEDRKIARVVKKLHMNEDTVRQILIRKGLVAGAV
jgi:hypothetical protein